MAHDLLAAIPLFAELSDAERADLSRLLQPRSIEANRAIFFIGELGTEFFIIESGQVIICYPDDNGREVTLAVLGPGHFFGELSLLDGGRRTATARTQVEAKLFVLGRESFHQFVNRHPSAAFHVMTVLGRRLRDNLDKLRGVKNANEVVQSQEGPFDRITERVATVFANEFFLAANLLFIIVWVIIQTLLYNHTRIHHPDLPAITLLDTPPTFFWLGFMITVESIVVSVFVLNSQKRQARRDSIKADLDYQVNRKAQLEVMHLHEKLDRMESMIRDNAGGSSARGS